ncbi:MAG: 2Fe-2S iron-sulfur cluster-binding protein [Pseudomonadota bacterium]
MVRNARIVSGLILITFVAGHLANLIIGLHSLAAMEAARPYLMGPWRTAPGTVLLAGAALVHIVLGLYALGARRSLAVSRTDVVQLLLGAVTPPLLLNHAVVMYMAGEVSPGFDSTFGQMLAVYWSFEPRYAFQQILVVMVVWMHAAIGLYSWLVLKPVWRRIGGLVLPLLFAIPILALLGFAEAGKEVLARLAGEPEWRAHIGANLNKVVKVTSQLDAFQARMLIGYAILVAIAAAVFAWRVLATRYRRVEVAYDAGLRARGRAGLSILELSRLNDIPHAHVCSGRARCGTCRVRVDAGAAQLSAIGAEERGTLGRVGAGEGERLACQARVLGAGVAVTRLLPAYADASAARSPQEWTGQQAAPAQGDAA